jgi:hypothetical protein
MSLYAVRLDTASGELEMGEIGAFITPQALITIRKSEDTPLEPLLVCGTAHPSWPATAWPSCSAACWT